MIEKNFTNKKHTFHLSVKAPYEHLVECYCFGCRLRFHRCTELCNIHTIEGFANGCCIMQLGITNIQCCVPATNPKEISRVDKIHPHQHRIPKRILDAFIENIKKSSLKKETFLDFEELFEFVVKVGGVSPCLLAYDFCLRYGDTIGIKPQKYVYLFNGARRGAEYMIGKFGGYKKKTIEFYPLLGKSLDSSEIEDFLCVCEDHIKYVSDLLSTKCPFAISTKKVITKK